MFVKQFDFALLLFIPSCLAGYCREKTLWPIWTCEADQNGSHPKQCKNIPARFQEWLAEILHRSEFLGWATKHFKGDSRNLAGMFLHNSECEILESGSLDYLICRTENQLYKNPDIA